VSKLNVLGRIPLTVRVGLALILFPLASLAVWAGWYSTRSWQPLNVPISLARGHFRAEFDINVESLYAIEVQLNQDRESERPACPDGTYSCDAVSLAGAPWSISSGERVLASGKGEPQDRVGSFQSEKGHYVRTRGSSISTSRIW
jgi:hypothetical protein